MNKSINNETLSRLRKEGVLDDNEIAYYSGDLIIVENVITKSRRVLDKSSSAILESRRILKG